MKPEAKVGIKIKDGSERVLAFGGRYLPIPAGETAAVTVEQAKYLIQTFPGLVVYATTVTDPPLVAPVIAPRSVERKLEQHGMAALEGMAEEEEPLLSEGEEPEVPMCDVCGQTFSNKGLLTIHRRGAHEEPRKIEE